MVCTRCGADVVPGAKRCGSCGTPVGNDDSTVVLPQGAGEYQPTMRMPAATYQPTQALPPTQYPQDQYPQDQYPPQGRYPSQGQYPPGGPYPPNRGDQNRGGPGKSLVPLIVAGVVLAIVLAVLLTYLVTRPDGGTTATPTSTGEATPSASPTTAKPTATEEPDPGIGSDNLLVSARRLDAPRSSGFELLPTGKLVRYDVNNLRDGDWDSVWRTPGDASGEDVEARWNKPVWFHEFQLTNGYAVGDDALKNRYLGERRITAITIEVDGDTVKQATLDPANPDPQTVTLDEPVEGKRLEVTIESTTDPASADQDYTAMTELVVR